MSAIHQINHYNLQSSYKGQKGTDMQCKKCNPVHHAFEMGRVYRRKGRPMNTVLYPGMVALNGAFQNGWLEEDIALRTGDDRLMDQETEDYLQSAIDHRSDGQMMKDNLDWAREY